MTTTGSLPPATPSRAAARDRLGLWADLVIGVGMAALIAMVGYVIANVTLRFTVGDTLPAVTEVVTRWLLVPLATLGWVVAAQRREHIDVRLLIDGATSGVRRWTEMVNYALTIAFTASIGYFGWRGAVGAMRINEYGVDSGLPVWVTRFTIPLASALLIWALLRQARTRLRGGDDDQAEPQGLI